MTDEVKMLRDLLTEERDACGGWNGCDWMDGACRRCGITQERYLKLDAALAATAEPGCSCDSTAYIHDVACPRSEPSPAPRDAEREALRGKLEQRVINAKTPSGVLRVLTLHGTEVTEVLAALLPVKP